MERKSIWEKKKKSERMKTFESGNSGVSVPNVKKIYIMRIAHGDELAAIRAHRGWKKEKIGCSDTRNFMLSAAWKEQE